MREKFFLILLCYFLAGEGAKSRGMSIEKKIEFLESLTGNVILFPNLQMITVM